MEKTAVFRSRPTNVYLAKFFGPLILMVPALGIFVQDFGSWRILLTLPFVIAAVFAVSIAILEVRNGGLRYKRFLRWRPIQEGEIVTAGVMWNGFIGYLQLRRFVPPWGRLYFALDADLDPNPFHRPDYALLRYLRKEPISPGQGSAPRSSAGSLKLRLTLWTGLGILSSAMILYLTPGNLLRGLPSPAATMPTPLKAVFQFAAWLHSLGVQIAALAVMAFLAVHRRDRGEGWLYAFLLGFALILVVNRLLS